MSFNPRSGTSAGLVTLLVAAAVISLAAPAIAQAPPTSAPPKTGEQSPEAKWSTKAPAAQQQANKQPRGMAATEDVGAGAVTTGSAASGSGQGGASR